MAYTEFDSDHTVETSYKKLIKHSSYGDFEVTSSVKNEQIVFKGKRSYDLTILVALIIVGVLLFIVGLIIAAIYYWTRPYQKIIIELEPKDTGSTITIQTNGKIQDITIHEIKTLLASKTE